jgi:thiamine biosynthesis protein ThiS
VPAAPVTTNAATSTVEVVINGEKRTIPANRNVVQVLHWLELPEDRVAVEMNKVIVRKRHWATVTVPSGATLEIVEFVGGG